MTWINQYFCSLKNKDVEERLDIYFYRPMAFIIIKILYPFPITPNHYSLMVLITGLISSFYFCQGNIIGIKLGGFFFLLSSTLDCCDGMLARLKKNGTKYGRLIDGGVDYIVNFAVYFSIGVGLVKMYPTHSPLIWFVVLIAGFSKFLQAAYYDKQLSNYFLLLENNTQGSQKELTEISAEVISAKNNSNFFKYIFFLFYLNYLRLQNSLEINLPSLKSQKSASRDDMAFFVKKCSYIGPTTHNTALIIASLINFPLILLIYSIVFGNFWLINLAKNQGLEKS